MEENDNQYVYIIDTYSKYEKDEIVEVFTINSRWYAIKKVKLNFGKPILSSMEKNEDESLNFYLYNTLEEAKNFVRKIKRAESAKF